MKNAPAYARKLSSLLARLRRRHRPHPPAQRDPVTQFVIAFLQWESTRKSAEAAFTRLMRGLVDVNDLRVSHPDEVANLLGERYPRVHERSARMHDSLQEVYVREHGVTLDPLAKMGKKEARAYLDSLPGMTPYVAALVTLASFEGHAVPVDENLAQKLREEAVVDDHATPQEIASFIEHHVKAGHALETHLVLQAWVDAHPPAGDNAGPRKKPAAGKKKR